jgi:predicted nucleotidyltransferase
MNLSDPLSSLFPGAHGQVLQVLARTNRPLTARHVAVLTEGGSSSGITKRRANDVLQELTTAGVVIRQDDATSYLYSLNPEHLAAGPIRALARLRADLLGRITSVFETWTWKPVTVVLFGSAARGTATERSDIDLLVVTPQQYRADEWDDQLSLLSEIIHRWSGNYCEILELTEAELLESVKTRNQLATDLLDHGLPLYGQEKAHSILRHGRRAPSTSRITYGGTTRGTDRATESSDQDEPNRPRSQSWVEDDE